MVFEELISTLSHIHKDLKEQGIKAINISLTLRNWFFGFYIAEFEQQGKDRAAYGSTILAKLAAELKTINIPNTDERELRRYRQFYQTYPNVFILFSNTSNIRGILTPVLQRIDNQSGVFGIRGLATPELEVHESHYINLFQRASYSHFVELMRLQDPLQRLFYELECLRGTWSVKELRRQIGSLLYERTGLSAQKEKLLALAKDGFDHQKMDSIIRDPYVFEFIGLKQQEVLPEKELEQALLDHLMHFLLELGKGFCFEARQKRIIIDNEHHFIDLVFYHRLLHCNVLIELKTERFHHAHSGQLNMYLEYFKKYELAKGDNPPVGILLCTDKDEEHVEFATAGIDDKVFVAKYLLALPDRNELEQFIRREMKELM